MARISNYEQWGIETRLTDNAIRAGLIPSDAQINIGAPYASNVWRIYVTAPNGDHLPCDAFSHAYESRRDALMVARSLSNALAFVGVSA